MVMPSTTGPTTDAGKAGCLKFCDDESSTVAKGKTAQTDVPGAVVVASGAMTVLVACRLLARRERGTLAALSVAGAASVALMSATNFLLYSNFRWLLLLPALLWLAGLLCYLRESAASPTIATQTPTT